MEFGASVIFLLSKLKLICCGFVYFPHRDNNQPDKSRNRKFKLLS